MYRVVVNYAWTAFSGTLSANDSNTHSRRSGTPVFPLYDFVITTGPELTAFWGQQAPLGIFTLMLLTRILTIALVATNFVYTLAVSEVGIRALPPPCST